MSEVIGTGPSIHGSETGLVSLKPSADHFFMAEISTFLQQAQNGYSSSSPE